MSRRSVMSEVFVWDKDLECMVRLGNNFHDDTGRSPNVISDDLGFGVNGLRHMPSGRMIDSKSGHYRENKARGLEHVGSEQNFEVKQAQHTHAYYGQRVKDTMDQLQTNYGGAADRMRQENERGGWQRRNGR